MGLCWSLLRDGTLDAVQDCALTAEMFRGEARDAFEFLLEHFRAHGVLPNRDTLLEDVGIDPEFDFDPVEPTSYYATKVRERWALTAQRAVLKEFAEAIEAKDPEQVHDVACRVVQVGLDNLDSIRGTLVDINKTAPERLAFYAELKAADGGIRGIRTPWAPIDAETGGLKKEDLVSIVARLGVGKTWLALVIAQFARVFERKKVGIISMEMARTSLQLRLDALEYGLPYRDLLHGELDTETEDRYLTGLADVQRRLVENEPPEHPGLHIATGGRVKNVADCEMFVQETGIDLLVVDGAYLLQEGGKNTPRHERVEMAVRGLKRLAQKRKIPVVQTVQFNRTVRTGATSAGSESIGHTDAIGQDSDVVIAMFQDENMRAGNQMNLRMLKNREGRPAELLVNWDLVLMQFDPLGGASDLRADDGGGDGGGGGGGRDNPDNRVLF